MDQQKETSSIQLNRGDLVKLQQIAARLGYISTRGPATGQGSLSRLLQAIAKGEIVIQSQKK